MRILDNLSNQSVENVTLYLTINEAKELRDSINDLIENPRNNHAHIPDENYRKEITVCIYNLDNLSNFDKRSIDLIVNDK